MEFKHPFYIKDADPKGVAEALTFLREFYTRYPTGAEVGEALHQIRRELNLIQETEVKRRKIKELEQELQDDGFNAEPSAVSTPSADTQGHKKPVRRRRAVADTGTGNTGSE